jgi:hypothetical protein
MFENRLNEVHFSGLPLGSMCCSFIFLNLYFQAYEVSAGAFVRLRLSRLKSRLLWMKTAAPLTVAPDPTILFAISTNVKKNVEFFSALSTAFSEYGQAIVSPDKSSFEIPAAARKSSYYTFTGLTPAQQKVWQQEFHTTSRLLDRTLAAIQDELTLPAQVVFDLKYVIEIQTRAAVYATDLIKQMRPMGVITDHDRFGLSSVVVLSANKEGVPTYTLIHGSTNPPTHYHPLLADYMICWGKDHYKQFSDLGIGKDKLLICGNQKMQRALIADRDKVRAKHGYKANDVIVLLVTNVIEVGQRLRFAEDFCEAVTQHPSLHGVLKLHPSEKAEDYAAILSRFPAIRIFDRTELDTEESFALCDHVITHNSIYGLEALVKGREVAVYAPSYVTFPLGIGERLTEIAGCPKLNDIDDLRKHLSLIADNKPLPADVNKQETLISNYVAAFGQEAADNIRKEVLKRL